MGIVDQAGERSMQWQTPGKTNLLGVGVSNVSIKQTLAEIQTSLMQSRRGYICVAASHSLMSCWRDDSLRSVFNRALMVTPDGMPLVWLLRLKGQSQVDRVYGPELLLRAVAALREQGIRHYFYGGGPGVVDKLARRLRSEIPEVAIVGTETPPFRPLTPEEDRQAIERINASGADIVWVGLGADKQERWMADHVDSLKADLLIGIGAAFDFISGTKPQAPGWMRHIGLEWLFRLSNEPRRLWPRYRQYPLFILLIIAQELGLRKFPVG